MNFVWFALIATTCIFFAECLPIETDVNQLVRRVSEQTQSGEIYGDDMIFLTDPRARGVARRPASTKWPNATVPYEFTSSISSANTQLILNSMRIVEDVTKVNGVECVKFRPKLSSDRYFIYIQNGSGCSASVGAFIGSSGNRTLTLLDTVGGPTCMDSGIIQHELLHVLGFYHEQSRPDRDQYVQILMQNIISGYEHNFNIYTNTDVDTLQTPYDVDSIMHYDAFSFSSNGQPTITKMDNTTTGLGQRNGLTAIDILEVQRFYNCVPTPSTTTAATSPSTSSAAVSSSNTGSSAATTGPAVHATEQNNAHRFTTNYFLTLTFASIFILSK